MKFSLKNIEVEFEGWALEFARVRLYDFIDFRDEQVALDDSRYNAQGGLNIESLTRSELKKLRDVTPKFMAKNLLSAKCGDESAESDKDKLLLIDFLSDNADFRTFCEGYINGEKKT